MLPSSSCHISTSLAYFMMAFAHEHSINCRRDFPALTRRRTGPRIAFLDGPGGSQVPHAVIDALSDFYATCNVNTHGKFSPSEEVDRRMDLARETLAAFLGAPAPSCISFGQNMTTLNYSLSAAIGRTLKPGDEVLITQLDHEANRGPWLRLADQGIVIQEVRLLESGQLDLADMEAKVTARTKVFALGASSNALGTVNDLSLARRLTMSVGALLVVDAVHFAPHFPLDVASLGMDFLLCSGYKFYGPHVGVLYSRPGALDRLPTDRLSVQDPAAPYRIETGTLNHAAIDALRAAVDYIATWGSGNSLRERIVDAMTGISAYEHGLAKFYHDSVRAISGVQVWGPDFSSRARAPTISITMDQATAGEAAAALGKQGICVWDGNFYAARAVEVLGLAGRGGLLRTGISMYSTREDLERLLAGIEQLAQEPQSLRRVR
jgi:cysteine desulfurase family protein (TIGR01976 family)